MVPKEGNINFFFFFLGKASFLPKAPAKDIPLVSLRLGSARNSYMVSFNLHGRPDAQGH